MAAHCSWWRCCCCFTVGSWLLSVVWCVCENHCIQIHLWLSSPHSFTVFFFFWHGHISRNRSAYICVVSSLYLLSFCPVLTVCCTTQFTLFTYMCTGSEWKKEMERNKTTTTLVTLNRSTPPTKKQKKTHTNNSTVHITFVLEVSVSMHSHSLYPCYYMHICVIPSLPCTAATT